MRAVTEYPRRNPHLRIACGIGACLLLNGLACSKPHTSGCDAMSKDTVDGMVGFKGWLDCLNDCKRPCCDSGIPIIRLTGIIQHTTGGFVFAYDSGDNGIEANPPGIPVLPLYNFVASGQWYRFFVREASGTSYRIIVGPRPIDPTGEGEACFEPRSGIPQLNIRRGWTYLWGHQPRVTAQRAIAVGTGTRMHVVVPPTPSIPEAIVFHQSSATAAESVLVTRRDAPTAGGVQLLPRSTAGALGSYCKATMPGVASLLSASEVYPPVDGIGDSCDISLLDSETQPLRTFAHAP